MKTKTLLKVVQWGLVFGWLPIDILVNMLTHGNRTLHVSWMIFTGAGVLILGVARVILDVKEERRERMKTDEEDLARTQWEEVR